MASVENNINLAISFDKKQTTEQSGEGENEFSSLLTHTLDSKTTKPQGNKSGSVTPDFIQYKERSQKLTSEPVTDLIANNKLDDSSAQLGEQEQGKKPTKSALEVSDNIEVNALFSQLQNSATATVNVKIFKANFGMDLNQNNSSLFSEKSAGSEALTGQSDVLMPLSSGFTLTPLSQFSAAQTAVNLPDEITAPSSLLATWFGQSASKKDAEISESSLDLASDVLSEAQIDEQSKVQNKVIDVLSKDQQPSSPALLTQVNTLDDKGLQEIVDAPSVEKSVIPIAPAAVSQVQTQTEIEAKSVVLHEVSNQLVMTSQHISQQAAPSLEQRILALMEQLTEQDTVISPSPAIAAVIIDSTAKLVTPLNERMESVSEPAKLHSLLSQLLPQVATALKSSNPESAALTIQHSVEIETAKFGLSNAQLAGMSELISKLSNQVDNLASELGLDKKELQDLFAKITHLVTPKANQAMSDDVVVTAPLLAKNASLGEQKPLNNPVQPTLIKSAEQTVLASQNIDRVSAFTNALGSLSSEPTAVSTLLVKVQSEDASVTPLPGYASSLPKGELLKEGVSKTEQENQKLTTNLAEYSNGDSPKNMKADINNSDKLQLAAEKIVHNMIERIAPEVYQAVQVSHTHSEGDGNINSISNLHQLVTQRTQVNTPPPAEAVPSQVLNMFRSEAAKELHDRVSVMLSLNKHEADIRLDPPELGSMQIRVRSDAEQAQINFVVQNQQAKEALEQSLPRLKEMLAEQGIQLGESNIEQQNQPGREQGDGQQRQSATEHVVGDEIAQTLLIPAQIESNRPGGVDFYA